jgi:hypothetical protein
MNKLLFFSCFLNGCSLLFALVTLLSNQWFKIQTINAECAKRKVSLSCLVLKNMENNEFLNFGVWFSCPKISSLNTYSLSWITNTDVFKSCFYLFKTQLASTYSNNSHSFLANHLNDKNLLDIVPQQIFLVQLLGLIGLFLQLTTVITILTLLLYSLIKFDSERNFENKNFINFIIHLAKQELIVKNWNKNVDSEKDLIQYLNVIQDSLKRLKRNGKINMIYESAKYHLIRTYLNIILMLFTLSFITRFIFFQKFSVYNYLDYLFRKSYSIQFQNDYFDSHYDFFIRESINKKYIIHKCWPLKLFLSSLVIELLAFFLLMIYSFPNQIVLIGFKKQFKKSSLVLKENSYDYCCSEIQDKKDQLIRDVLPKDSSFKKESNEKVTFNTLKNHEELYEIISNYTNEENELSKLSFNFNKLIIREKILKF